MLLLNLKNISSIEINEPELFIDIIYKNNQYVKLNKHENYQLKYQPITNTRDIENLKRDFIIKEDKLYTKPTVSLKEVDGKTHTINFKTIDEFNTFIDNKIKPNFDLFFII